MDAPELTPEIIEFPAAQPVPSKAVLYAKLARVMGRVKRVAKSGKNTHFGYTFATADDMYDTVREALAEENVALLVDMLGVEREGKKTKVKFEFIFACGDTGAIKACQWESEADDTQDKGINKAATFAMKYFLKATFLISTGDITDDPDGDDPVQDKKPAATEAGQDADTPKKPGKKPTLRDELMRTVDHPRFSNPLHLKNAIDLLFKADILYEGMAAIQATGLVSALGNYRDDGLEPGAAIEAVRKLTTQPDAGE